MKYVLCLIFLLLHSSCSKKLSESHDQKGALQVEEGHYSENSEYEQSLKDWRMDRLSSVKAPLGWLSVVGLHWLDEGENSIGSSKKNKIRLDDNADPNVGKITLDQGQLNFKGTNESLVTIGKNEHLILGKIESDAGGQPTMMNHHSYTFYVIKRGKKYGLRIKDTLSDARINFKGIPHFPTNESLLLPGKVLPTKVKDSIQIQNAIGQNRTYHLKAKIQFEHMGKVHELHALDGGPNTYFIIFEDKTTGKETYGGGRFLYVEKPKDGSNKVMIDFNKSINPPCVFTDYATCPLPPEVNKLKFLVHAGEKNLKSH